MTTLLNLGNLESNAADELVDLVLARDSQPRVCITCSFQAEDIIVLNLLRKRVPQIPVLFLETGYHFAETYRFRDRLVHEWNLNLVNVMPKLSVAQQESQLGILYRNDPARCCHLRKVEPLFE